MKPRIALLIAAALAFTLTSCETMKRVPLTIYYEADVGGHSVKTGYTPTGGAFISGRRVLSQK